jgi:hypothetical protein
MDGENSARDRRSGSLWQEASVVASWHGKETMKTISSTISKKPRSNSVIGVCETERSFGVHTTAGALRTTKLEIAVTL